MCKKINIKLRAKYIYRNKLGNHGFECLQLHNKTKNSQEIVKSIEKLCFLKDNLNLIIFAFKKVSRLAVK
jgi:hypothetical protein